jgi:hypothetical protein
MRSWCARTSCDTWRWGRITTRLARGDRRDRARRGGDDVLDRRGVRPDRVHAGSRGSGSSRSRSPSPARCSCRCSSRSRSTRCSRPTGRTRISRTHEKSLDHEGARPLQRLVRPAGGGYKRVIAWALDHRVAWSAIAVGTFVFALGCRRSRSGLVGVSFFPSVGQRRTDVRWRRRRGPTWTTRAEDRRRWCASSRRTRGAYSFATIARWGVGRSGGRRGERLREDGAQGARGGSCRRSSAKLRDDVKQIGGATVAVFTTGFGGGRKQIQIELRGHDGEKLQTGRGPALAAVRGRAGRGGRGLSHQGAEAGAGRAARPRAGRFAGHLGGPGGPGLASRLRRTRCRRLAGSVGRDARRGGAPGPRGAGRG